MRDLKELQANPVQHVVAVPLDNDIYEWHGNFTGTSEPFTSTVFHFILKFPLNYPASPPSVTLCTPVNHRNVFQAPGGAFGVCLDMLETGSVFGADEQKSRPYTGWTASYSVLSVLLQLQAFLLDPDFTSSVTANRPSAITCSNAANRYQCPKCGHQGNKNCFPRFPTKKELETAQKEKIEIVKPINLASLIGKEPAPTPAPTSLAKSPPSSTTATTTSTSAAGATAAATSTSAAGAPAAGKKAATTAVAKPVAAKPVAAKQPAPVPVKVVEEAAWVTPKKSVKVESNGNAGGANGGANKPKKAKKAKKKAEEEQALDSNQFAALLKVRPDGQIITKAPPKPQQQQQAHQGGWQQQKQQPQQKQGGQQAVQQPSPWKTQQQQGGWQQQKQQQQGGWQQQKQQQQPAQQQKQEAEVKVGFVQMQLGQGKGGKKAQQLQKQVEQQHHQQQVQQQQQQQKQQLAQQKAQQQQKQWGSPQLNKAQPQQQQQKAVAPKAAAAPLTAEAFPELGAKPEPQAKTPKTVEQGEQPVQPQAEQQKPQQNQQQSPPPAKQTQQQQKPQQNQQQSPPPAKQNQQQKPQQQQNQQQKPQQNQQQKPQQQQNQQTAKKPAATTTTTTSTATPASPAKTTEASNALAKLHQMTERGRACSLIDLPYEIVHAILLWTDVRDVTSISLVCKQLHEAAEEGALWKQLFSKYYPRSMFTAKNMNDWKYVFQVEVTNIVDSLKCYYTKSSFEEDVLGIPIVWTENPKLQEIDCIYSTMDLLSREAFVDNKVRLSVWKESFTNWLPLYITKDHFARAAPHLEKTFVQLCYHWKTTKFSPHMVAEVIPKIMNTLVVLLSDNGVHASEKVLSAYCALHRLFIAYVEQYPAIQHYVDQKLELFCRDAGERHKNNTPNLGFLIPLLCISSLNWRQVIPVILEETMDRNVIWAVKKYEGLLNVTPGPVTQPDFDRLNKTFDANHVSLRLFMIQVAFFRRFRAKPDLREIAQDYDRFYGFPPHQELTGFQNTIKKIFEVTSWPQFYVMCGLKPPNPVEMTKILHENIRASRKKNYHNSKTNFSRIHASGVSKILLKGESYSCNTNIKRVMLEQLWGFPDNCIYLDASCLIYLFNSDNANPEYVDYQKTKDNSSSIRHSGDVIDYETNSGKHTINVDLNKLPKNARLSTLLSLPLLPT